ncbi:PfkB family carbohydrate kinase [Alkalihalobacillus hemicellulosilyticus]|uniref:Fructokinase n=1 Tax=Halalkalibacter hemicellulosilyticusJCM 9152 TaxID=1236971 RepID=W4QAT3_9BACI|nr:PfkB family carbohydrate kinase [Halalkalibacter hemicellulosilyticus]GAE28788.1 fructokinase [Halalkalibacter hemicellulosilyticusJCM 9152]
MTRIICLGEVLIDFVPTVNGYKLKEVSEFRKFAGGAPANVSATIARLGGESFFIGKVGKDAFGEYVEEVLSESGVNTHYLLKTDKANTALAFVSLQRNGERDFMFYRQPAADMLLERKDINEKWFYSSPIFHFGSISLIDEPIRSATKQAIQYARKRHSIISFDPNIRLGLWPSEQIAREQILEQLSEVNIVKLSEDELYFLTHQRKEQEAVKKVMKGEVKLVLITKGNKGCSFYTKYGFDHVQSIKVHTVDTTGAGDAFVGGFLYKLAEILHDSISLEKVTRQQRLLKEIVLFANGCGALTTMNRGAIAALPSKEDVNSLLQDIVKEC